MSAVALTPRTATVTLYDGDDLARINTLRAAAEAAANKNTGGPSALAVDAAEWLGLAQEHDRFVTEATSRAVVVTLKALNRKTWRDLVAEHPPRDGVEGDERSMVNEETFPEVLVPVCITAPDFGSDTDRDVFLNSLSSADFDNLYLTAWRLNRGSVVDPKASLVSDLTARNAPTSK